MMRKFSPLLLIAVSFIAHAAAPKPKPLIIRHVLIYDGSGDAPHVGDVQITGDKITAVSSSIPTLTSKADELDGRGLALAPGFIDMHSHADGGIFKDPSATVMIRQGVTTALVGQDGGSEYPLADFFAKLEKTPTTINIVSMAGQGTLREQVMGNDLLRASTPEELARMKQLL